MKSLKVLFPFVAVLLVLSTFTACDLLEDIDNSLSESEVADGLKEALRVSTDTSVSQLNREDGFYGDLALRILLPQEAQVANDVVSVIPGGSQLIEQVILRINRAAEDAAGEAAPIFIDAITSLTIQDAFSILNGPNNAATMYLENNTRNQLYTAFQPKINNSLSTVGAQQSWNTLINQYNSIPLVQDINPDLSDHTTNKALDGLFVKLAEEEQQIRENPLARVTELLQRVFGNN